FLQIVYGLLVMGYLIKKNWKRAIEIAVIGLGGFVINYFMKLSFQRQRPPDPLIEPLQNFSFPSGHATSGFIFYGLLVYLLWKSKLKQVYKYIFSSVLIIIAIIIGFSRIYLRLHYLSDVVAGFCIGFAWLAVAIWMMERVKKKSDIEINKR
ncbi:MAG: phosphatase PAP2 family protein, partial [Chitinophagaceae bacterium]